MVSTARKESVHQQDAIEPLRRAAAVLSHPVGELTLSSPWIPLNLSVIPTGLIESGRGLAALQNAIAPAKRARTPPGFGVRPVLCRFASLRRRLTDSVTGAHAVVSLKCEASAV